MADRLIVMHPGREEPAVDTIRQKLSLTIRGATLGAIENTKFGFRDVVLALSRQLQEHAGLARLEMVRKSNMSVVARPELVNQVVANARFAITGLGD